MRGNNRSTLAFERARVEAILSSTMEGISRSTQSLGGDKERRIGGREKEEGHWREVGGGRKIEDGKRTVEGKIRNADGRGGSVTHSDLRAHFKTK